MKPLPNSTTQNLLQEVRTFLLSILFNVIMMMMTLASFAQCPSCPPGGPSPPGDQCANAVNIGSLPAPNPCNGSANEGIGDTASFNLTNVCATPASPYNYITSCRPNNQDMAHPADDIWVRVNVTGSELFISLNSGLSEANIGIWDGDTCNAIVGVECIKAAGGNVSTTVNGLTPGLHYLQISGDGIGDQCDFSLSLSNNNNCSSCVVQSNFSVTPQPINGSYPAGTTVDVCYTITQFDQQNNNWLHGIQVDLGPGWDTSTLITNPPMRCENNGQGVWGWHDQVIGSGTGDTVGPGFFYDRDQNGNPGDNFGDNCDGAVNWQFCFQITTPTCDTFDFDGTDLSININTFSDGETGSWTQFACASDPTFNFSAILFCCTEPTVSSTNTSCPGGSDGQATATGTGDSPWRYRWTDTSGTVIRDTSGIQGSDTLTGLPAGDYIVQVVDSNGCTSFDTVTVNDPPDWNVAIDTTNVSCNGDSDGSLDLTVSGATPPYSYMWSNNSATQDISSLSAGTFVVTITDSLSCQFIDSATVTEPPGMNVSGTVTNVACHDSASGAIDLTVMGGSAPYSYNWSGGSTSQDTLNIGAGAYRVTVTDANGCQRLDTFTVNQPPPLSVTSTTSNVSCHNGQDGAIDVSVGGGTGSYSYAWSSGSTTQDTTGVEAGSYTVTVTDANGCSIPRTETITEPDSLVAFADSVPVPCNGGSQGQAAALPTGGTPGYTYQWNDPSNQIDSVATGLPVGSYRVTVTDNNGCQDTASTTVTQPDSIQIDLDTTDVTCNGGTDGAVNGSIAGGTPPYSIQWSNGATSQSITGLTAGNYCCTVTDANGCSSVACATVSEPPPISLSASHTDANCNQADGSASVNASGGTPSYSYQWNDPAMQQNDTAFGLPPGNYQVVVTDSAGCIDSTSVTIGNIGGPTASIQSSSNVSCFGGDDGSATVSVAGGTTPYTYQWNDSLNQTTPTANNLRADTLTAVVTDSQGCAASDTVIISQPQPIALVMDSIPTYCRQDSGSAMVRVSGGTMPYSFLWDDPDNQTTDSASTLGPGTYQVQVTDGNGCSATDSVEVPNRSGGTLIIADSSDVSCFGGTDGMALATVTNGSPPFNYVWNDPLNQMTPTASNLTAGSYSVTVTEGNGCQDTASVTINEPAQPLSITLSADSATCSNANGSAFVTAAGGTPPYSYLWNDSNNQATDTATGLTPGRYQVTVTDTNGCQAIDSVQVGDFPAGTISINAVQEVSCAGGRNGIATASINGGNPPFTYTWNDNLGQTTATADSLQAGTFTVSVIDSAGCLLVDSVTITEPSPLLLTMDSTNTGCGQANGQASVSASGGTTPYSYQWNDPAQQTTATASNLGIGAYTVTVTDANNCRAVDSVQVVNPNLGTPTITQEDVSCFGGNDGTATVSMSGGTPPFSYQWNDPSNQAGPTATNLSAGAFQVTITDNAGCTVIDSVTIDQPQAALVIDSASSTNATCGEANGTAMVAVSGGTVDSTYTYTWDDSAAQTTPTANNLPPGSYTVTVIDDNGCSVTRNFTLANIPGPTIQTQSSPVSCFGGSDGSASVSITGGTSPFQIQWSNGGQEASISGITAGDYQVIVSDSNNCQEQQTVPVGSPPEVRVDAGPNDTIQLGQQTTLNGSISNQSNIQAFRWTPQQGVDCPAGGASNQCLQPTVAPRQTTTYTLSATDINNCQYSDTTRITVNIEPDAFAPNAFTPDNDDLNDEFMLITRKVEDFELQIFNRWGELLFETSNPNEGWDGTSDGEIMSPGVYVYVADIRFTDGEREVMRGSLTLIR